MPHIVLDNGNYPIDHLPAAPSLLVELLDLCFDSEATFEDFSLALKKDPGLAAKIIQVANSPAYRQWNKISDFRRLLIVLGMANVKKIVQACAIEQFFARFSSDFNKSSQHIWHRSLLCAHLAERLAILTGYDKPGEAFLVGLLHQVGMLIQLINRETEYLPLLEHYVNEPEAFCRLEQSQFQTNHCELGAALVAGWQLDSFIAEAIQYQWASADELKNAPVLLKIVAVAAPLSASNQARNNRSRLEKAGILFDLTEATILDCLDIALDRSQQVLTGLGFSDRIFNPDDLAAVYDFDLQQHHDRELGLRLKNIALSQALGKSDKSDYFEFIKELRAAFSLIFNINQLCFFAADEQHLQLKAVNDFNLSQLDEIVFSPQDQQSLLTRAFHDNQAYPSFHHPCSISDRQVIRIFGTDGAYFLPLSHQDQRLGVLALGINELQWQHRPQEKSLLFKLLSRQIAAHVLTINKTDQTAQGMSLVEFRKIAHEVSNPLTIINNYLYVLERKIGSEHPAQEEIRFISEEIERAGNILLRAKDPDTQQVSRDRTVDVNQLIRELDSLFKSSLYRTKMLESVLNLDPELPPVICSGDKLKQVLINIIKNAAEAVPEKACIEIMTRDNFFQHGGQYLEITISDNGPGIPPEILKHLFKPVTSTKAGHSGLGLSIVGTLIDEMSGHISCHSKQNSGTTFKIHLPRVVE